MATYLFQLAKENYDFFPLDRALSLAAMGQDSTEAKIDDLLYQVTSIVDKQKREVFYIIMHHSIAMLSIIDSLNSIDVFIQTYCQLVSLNIPTFFYIFLQT